MSFKRRINSEVEKVVETYLDTACFTTAQRSALQDAFRHLADENLCLVLIAEHESDSGCTELVLANKDMRTRYDERRFKGIEVDVFDLRYLESQVLPLDGQDLRKKLEEADRELDRVKRVLERQEQAAAELRRQLIEQGPAKTLTPIQDRLTVRPYPLSGQHELVQKSRSKS